MLPVTADIPMPIQIVIDDVGWWSGMDGSRCQEPFRTGFVRDHVLADYAAIASLGRQLKMRPQAAFILCEWDKENLLRKLPSSTWMGENWDNTRWVGPWLEEAADMVRTNKQHLEFTLHGIGHEYWTADGAGRRWFTRAEWCDSSGQLRPRDEILARIEYFQKLMDQHELGEFPQSYVPCAFRHRFDRTRDGLAAILKDHGIEFISTPFHCMHGVEEVSGDLFDVQSDVVTVDRGPDIQQWNASGLPSGAELHGPICGMHWPNILHAEPQRNEEVVGSWVSFYRNTSRV